MPAKGQMYKKPMAKKPMANKSKLKPKKKNASGALGRYKAMK